MSPQIAVDRMDGIMHWAGYALVPSLA